MPIEILIAFVLSTLLTLTCLIAFGPQVHRGDDVVLEVGRLDDLDLGQHLLARACRRSRGCPSSRRRRSASPLVKRTSDDGLVDRRAAVRVRDEQHREADDAEHDDPPAAGEDAEIVTHRGRCDGALGSCRVSCRAPPARSAIAVVGAAERRVTELIGGY